MKEEGDDDAEVDDIFEVDGASLAPLVDASAFSFLALKVVELEIRILFGF